MTIEEIAAEAANEFALWLNGDDCGGDETATLKAIIRAAIEKAVDWKERELAGLAAANEGYRLDNLRLRDQLRAAQASGTSGGKLTCWEGSLTPPSAAQASEAWEVYEEKGRIWPMHIGIDKRRAFKVIHADHAFAQEEKYRALAAERWNQLHLSEPDQGESVLGFSVEEHKIKAEDTPA